MHNLIKLDGAWNRYYNYFLFLAGAFSFLSFYSFSFFSFLSKFLYIYTMLTFMIDKILNYKTYTDRMKIDALLEIDCNNYANLGSDSTKTEKLEVKKQSRQIYRAIKTINPALGERFLRTMDK